MRLFPKLFLILLTLSLIILNSISCKLNLLGRGEFYLLIVTSNGSFYKASPDGNIIGEIGEEINMGMNDLHISAVSPDRKKVLFLASLNNGRDDLVIVDSNSVINLTQGMKGKILSYNYKALFSPDGKKIAFTIQSPDVKRSQLWVVNSDGTERKNLTEGMEGELRNFTFSPDSNKLLFEFTPLNSEKAQLWIIDFNGTKRKNLTEGMDGDAFIYSVDNASFLPFTPDSSKVLFEFYPSNSKDSQLWIVNSDGTGRKNLTEGMKGHIHFNPSGGPSFFPFSPDGKIIIFGFIPSNSKNNQLWIVNHNETKRKNLTEGIKGEGYFTKFTPDGKKIVFSVYVGFDNSQLWIVNQDGTERKNLTENMEGEALSYSSSSISPDGKRILVTFEPKDSINSFYPEYWLINLENNEKKKIEINKIAEITEQYKIEDLIWLFY